MKIADIFQEVQKGLSGKKLYISAALAMIYWAGAGYKVWGRDPAIDAAAGFAVLAALRAGSATDAKKAVKAIKADTAKTIKAEVPAAVVKAQEGETPAA